MIRWERKWSRPDKPYVATSSYNADSITTVATHDCATLAQWWQSEDTRSEAQAYCRYKGWDESEAGGTPLSVDRRRAMLLEAHRTPSLLHVSPLSEYLGLEAALVHDDKSLERVNVPGTAGSHNWRARMRPTLEALLARPTFIAMMRGLVSNTTSGIGKE